MASHLAMILGNIRRLNTSYCAEWLLPLNEPADRDTVQRYREFEGQDRQQWLAESR